MMFARCFLVLLLSTLCFDSEAKLQVNFEDQENFLDSLYQKFEKLKFKKQKADHKDDEEESDNTEEIDKYIKDINVLKKNLISIKAATARKDANKKVLKDLVDAFNRQMEELEKNYKFILTKSKKDKPDDVYFSQRSNDVKTMDSIRQGDKRTRIRDKYRPLEIIEISSDATKTEKLPIENRE